MNAQVLFQSVARAVVFWVIATPVVVAAAELEKQPPIARLSGHEADTYGLAFSRDGKLLISGSADGTIKVWDVAAKKLVRTLEVPKKDGVFGIVLSADGKLLAARCRALPILRLWDLTTGESRAPARQPLGTVEGVAISPDGRTVAVGLATYDDSPRVLLYDAATLEKPRGMVGHTANVFSVAFSPDGKTLASASEDGKAILWDVASGKVKRTLSTGGKKEPRIVFSPDGRFVAASGGPKTAKVFDTETGRLVSTFAGHLQHVTGLAFTPSGKMVASGDSYVLVWDVASSKAKFKFSAVLAGRVGGLAIHPSGKMIAWSQFLERDIYLARLPTDGNTKEAADTSTDAAPPAWTEPLRKWKDSTGRRTIQATLIEIRDDHITLKRVDGRVFTAPLERFSEKDRQYVKGRHAEEPKGATEARALQASWAKEQAAKAEVTNSIGMKLRLIPPGECLMGSPKSEEERRTDESQHPVRLTRAFYFSAYEVTQEQYERVTGKNPSWFSSGGGGKESVADMVTSKFPVERANWFDAVEFCNKLSEHEKLPPYYRREGVVVTIRGGNGYRLPTETEWEYACRAGTTTPFHFGSQCNGKEANVDGNSPYGTTEEGPYLDRTTTVGSYPPNAFGLFDMHGNVWEWCQDWHGPNGDEEVVRDPVGPSKGVARVLRGGSFFSEARNVRSAKLGDDPPINRDSNYGFRLARTYP